MAELTAQAAETLQALLSHMGMAAEVVTHEEAERVVLEVRGDDAALVIGKHGVTLDALQYLVNKLCWRGTEGGDELERHLPIVVDAEGYRQRRSDALIDLARRMADKARKTHRPVVAAPMSAGDRRVMHLALAEEAGIRTHSEGEGAARHLVVTATE